MISFQEYIDEFLEGTDEAISPAQRRKRNAAHLKKTMKKYGDATKMGMNPADVNQRRNKPTLKKR